MRQAAQKNAAASRTLHNAASRTLHIADVVAISLGCWFRWVLVWLVAWLVGLAGCLVYGWLVCRLVGWLVRWFVGWASCMNRVMTTTMDGDGVENELRKCTIQHAASRNTSIRTHTPRATHT